jgi:prepilin-type N-terminal cleavage/methylation domain-containing protein
VSIIIKKKGFTLIEILLVVAIISILLVVVFAALNPAQRLQDTRNARRWNDVNQVLSAVQHCILDADGDYGTCGLTNPLVQSQLGTCASGGATLCTGADAVCLDLSTELASYIKSLPLDPSGGSAATTGYSITITNGIVTIDACSAEDSAISVSR